jgi:two-component system, NtrC family, sensor kinase
MAGFSRSSSYFILPSMLAVVLAFLAGVELWRSYHLALREGEREAENLIHLLAEQMERTVQAIDLTLVGMRDALAVAPDTPPNDPRLQATLKRRLAALPFVRALFVIGLDGFLIHDTDYPSTPNVSLADRPYFEVHRNDPDVGLYVGHPLRSRSINVWFISVSRRLNNADGTFAGVAVAAVEPRYFERFFASLVVGDEGAISLFLKDGTLLARTPNREELIGKSFSTVELFRSPPPAGSWRVYWTNSAIDGTQRVIGARALTGAPIIVSAGLAERAVLQAWHQYARVVAGGGILLLVLIAVSSALLHRFHVREEREKARVARSQRLETLGRIAGGIAHDFGNTIRIIQSTLTLLRPSLANQPDAVGLMADADRTLKSAYGMIDRLLAFARRQELRPTPVDLRELLSGFTPILRQAAGPRVQLDLDLRDTATCLIDPAHLEAALLNVVLNCREALPNGGRIILELHKTTRPARHGRQRGANPQGEPWAEIVIRDNGVGMPRDVQERALDPFFTTKEAGSGLGLSQVLGFVQQSAGELQLESEEGVGTTVRLLFLTTRDRPAAKGVGLSAGAL